MSAERFDKLEIGIVPPAGGSPPSQPASGNPLPAGAQPKEPLTQGLDAASGLHVSAETERVVIRLNGNVYREGDPDLPPFARKIIARVREKGLSPELMDELRREIPDVRFRPAVSARPSAEESDFWRAAGWRGDRWERGWGGYRLPVGLPGGMPLVVVVAIVAFIFAVWMFIQKQVGDTLNLLDRL